MWGLRSALAVAFCAAVVFVAAPKPHAAQAASSTASDPKLIEDLVYANRILYHEEVLDGFGHVSARSDKNPDHFLMSRSMAPGLVTAADIMEFDREGEPVDARGRTTYVERYIHAAIYRARPDVKAIVHSHSLDLIPYGVTGTVLRPVYHMTAFLGAGAPIFDIHDEFGDTDMLIRNNTLGDALAKSLGSAGVVVMRGHGFVAVADSVQHSVYRAIYTQLNARVQSEAAKLGPVKFLTPGEAAKAAVVTEGVSGRSWELWKASVGKIE